MDYLRIYIILITWFAVSAVTGCVSSWVLDVFMQADVAERMGQAIGIATFVGLFTWDWWK